MTFLRAHPELEGLEWYMPLSPEPQSRRAWKKEQRIARAYTPAYPPPRPASPKLMHISASSAKPYMPSQKAMRIKFYAHSKTKQSVDEALVDSGATKNFMNLGYTCHLQFPIQLLPEPQMVYNIDGSPNQSGEIKYYTDLNVQTGQDRTTFRFFLTNIGDSKVILGYPWMCAIQPGIDWRRGWINYKHLPIVFRTPGTS